jgi:phage shock protein PspC (stress-responsive transcriptional regulator)
MTDTFHQPKVAKPDLDPCDQEILTFARQVGISGAFLFFGGVIALIATSSQTDWDIARSLYVVMVVLGPLGIVVAQRLLRILMKHRRKELSIFEN